MESGDEVIRGVSFRSCRIVEWVKLKGLGAGGHGFVDLAMIIKPVPRLVAVKYSPSSDPSLQKECKVLQRFIGCPNIIQCYDEIRGVEYGGVVHHSLFLEYADEGSLCDLIDKYGGKIPESDARHYARMILEGLCYIHEKGYVHCDIKPGNILVYRSNQSGCFNTLKIADFGSAKEPGERDDDILSTDTVFLRRRRGTLNYMSPESLMNGEITAAMDVWSLGCVVAEMITGEPPLETMIIALTSRETPDSTAPQNMSMEGKDFLRRCFARDPHQRWTAKKLLNHPFVFPHSTQGKILFPHLLMQKAEMCLESSTSSPHMHVFF